MGRPHTSGYAALTLADGASYAQSDRMHRRRHQGNRLNDAEPKLAGYPGISGRMSLEWVAGYVGVYVGGNDTG